MNPESADAASWLAGYRAAVVDAIAEVDALSGPCNHSLSAPVMQRVRDRLAKLPERARHAVA